MANILEQLRDAKEREAKEYSDEIKKWLNITDISLKALLTAAAHGNLRCREAVKEILPMLPSSITVGPTPAPNDKEQQEVWSYWKERLATEEREQPVRELRKPRPSNSKPLRAVSRKVQRKANHKKKA